MPNSPSACNTEASQFGSSPQCFEFLRMYGSKGLSPVHQNAYWRFDDVVVVREGEPLGVNKPGSLAKVIQDRLWLPVWSWSRCQLDHHESQ